MNFEELYGKDNPPTEDQVKAAINNSLWISFHDFLKETYSISPKLEYSCCSMQKGWNVKYKKNGRNLCTAYPQLGYFKLMVVINEGSQEEADLIVECSCDVVKAVYYSIPYTRGSKWMMFEIKDNEVLLDVLSLIALRAREYNIKPIKG